MASESSPLPSELDLLDIEIGTIWRVDGQRRLLLDPGQEGPVPLLVVGVWQEERIMATANDLSEAIHTALAEIVNSGETSPEPFVAPSYLQAGADALAHSHGPVMIEGGPSFTIPPGTRNSSSAVIHTECANPSAAFLTTPPAETRWEPDEWRHLLTGDLGPWAMAALDERIVSICHSARLTSRAAEAGVWTDPAFRGKGHAAAVTAAWADLIRPSGLHIFYSTSSANLSSQRVASRLNLRPIGWIWKLVPAPSA